MVKSKLLIMLFGALFITLLFACKEDNVVSVDTTPPEVKIINPKLGSILTEPVKIILSITDNSKIGEVFVIIDDDTLARLIDAPYEYDWNVGYWADGEIHTILAVAKDEAGNIGKSDMVEVTVSINAKILPILIEPANNDVLPENETVTFSWESLTDTKSYELVVSTDSIFSNIVINKGSTDTSFTESSLSTGLYYWHVRALNNNDKYSAWGKTFQFSKGNLINAVLGFWMWGSTLSQGSSSVVKKLSENNVSDVFVLIKGISGTKTSADLLDSFITKAHEKNIKVHLWYVVSSDGVFVGSHKDAHIYHSPKPSVSNAPYPMDDERINLLYPGYKKYVLDNIRYFLENFDCDGLHLDYIRYSHFVYSFDENHIEKAKSLGCNTDRILNMFTSDYNYYAYQEGFVSEYAKGDSDVVKWVNLRKNTVYDYIKSIKELQEEIKPKIMFSASFMPEGALDPKWADSYYSQNYALNSELLDFIAPMSYFKDYGKPTSWIKTVTKNAIKEVDGKCKILSGGQTYGNISAREVGEQIKYGQEATLDGILFFRYGDTSSDAWKEINEQFEKWPDN